MRLGRSRVNHDMTRATHTFTGELRAVGSAKARHAEAPAVDTEAAAIAVARAPPLLARFARITLVAVALARLVVALAALRTPVFTRVQLAREAAESGLAYALLIEAAVEPLRRGAVARTTRLIACGPGEVGVACAHAGKAAAMARAILRAR